MIKLYKIHIAMICAAALLTGCAGGKAPVQTEGLESVVAEGIDYLSVEGISVDPGVEIAMIATDSGNSFYDEVKEGAYQAVEDFNQQMGYSGKDKLTLSFAAPKTENVIDQINIIDQFLDKAPDAMCIAFSDATACKTQLQMAKNNGIHLTAFDTPDDGEAAETLVTTDNKEASAIAAGKMFNAVNYKGKIAVIVHNSEKQNGQERYSAITKLLAEKYGNKDLRFVDVVYLAQDNRSEKEILDGLLKKHPDLSGIICTDLVTTEMVIDYSNDLKEKKFSVVGFDMSEKIAKAVEEGTILGTIAQSPYHMGYASVVATVRSVMHLENAEKVYTGHLWVDASNLESEEVQEMLQH